jgi:catalase-peroxidase
MLAPRNYSGPILAAIDNARVMGLTPAEYTVLAARPRSASQQQRLGYSGSWAPGNSSSSGAVSAETATDDGPAPGGRASNEYFKVLLNNQWTNSTAPGGQPEFTAAGPDGSTLYMTADDMALRWDPVHRAAAQEYAEDAAAFERDFAAAWAKVMNADRFAGPFGSPCYAGGGGSGDSDDGGDDANIDD